MLSHIVRRSLPTAAQVARQASIRPAQTLRAFSVAAPRFGGHDVENPTVFQGPGAQPGTVPTDYDQSTGLERGERLAQYEGRELFDMKPFKMTHLGTRANPIVIDSVDEIRHIGCTGYPAESHDTIWLNVDRKHEIDRCPKCGSVFKMNFIGEEGGHHH